MWKSKILFLWRSCAYERLTFRGFGANLRKVDTHKHEEEESTSADTLQRDFQLRGRSLLRGNEEGRMEDGFGVAGLNCLKLTDKFRQVRLLQREILQQMSIGTVCIRAVREISK